MAELTNLPLQAGYTASPQALPLSSGTPTVTPLSRNSGSSSAVPFWRGSSDQARVQAAFRNGNSDVISPPPSMLEDALQGSRTNAIDNSYLSQQFAREQMDFQALSQLAAMEFNSKEAAKNRDWQAYMSNTAHQREVRDLLAAGLNPILSAMGGNGATTGSGATASSQAMSGASGNVDTSANQAVASLVATALQAENQYEMNKTNAITNLAIAEAQRKNQTDLTKMQIESAQKIADKQAEVSKYAADSSSASSKYSSDTSYAIAQLTTAATMYAAAQSAGAIISSAGINAGSAQSINAANIENQRYMAEHFPTTPTQAAVGALTGATGESPGSGAYAVVDALVSGIGNWYRNTEAWARGNR